MPRSGCGAVGLRAASLLGALEVDADPCTRRARRLGHRVDPLLLAATAHHHEISGRRMEGDTGAAGLTASCPSSRWEPRAVSSSSRAPAAREPVAMPAGAVLA